MIMTIVRVMVMKKILWNSLLELQLEENGSQKVALLLKFLEELGEIF